MNTGVVLPQSVGSDIVTVTGPDALIASAQLIEESMANEPSRGPRSRLPLTAPGVASPISDPRRKRRAGLPRWGSSAVLH